jgi:hypothetical protein
MITKRQLIGGAALAASAAMPGLSAKAAAPSWPDIREAKAIAKETGLRQVDRNAHRGTSAEPDQGNGENCRLINSVPIFRSRQLSRSSD